MPQSERVSSREVKANPYVRVCTLKSSGFPVWDLGFQHVGLLSLLLVASA